VSNLSRLICPVVSNGWARNKKLLIGLGSLCLLYTISAKRFGLEDLLKLPPGIVAKRDQYVYTQP